MFPRIKTGVIGRVDAVHYLLTPMQQLVNGFLASILLNILLDSPFLHQSLRALVFFIGLGVGPSLVALHLPSAPVVPDSPLCSAGDSLHGLFLGHLPDIDFRTHPVLVPSYRLGQNRTGNHRRPDAGRNAVRANARVSECADSEQCGREETTHGTRSSCGQHTDPILVCSDGSTGITR